MKFFRWGAVGQERPGAFDAGGKKRDLTSLVQDFGHNTLHKLTGEIDLDRFPVVDETNGSIRFGPPISRPGKVLCAGLNYRAHVNEAGAKVPEEPVLFLKSPTSLSGANDDVDLPSWSNALDWEVELCVVIARRARNITTDQALDHVFGYAVGNDLSDREIQLNRGGQWTKGKSADGFCPLGPYLVTPDEVENIQSLSLWTRVNGETVQRSSTADMIFSVAEIIAYASNLMTLEEGDVIMTGTPEGCAMGRANPPWLKRGDIVESGIDGLGDQSFRIVA
ncbi:fumarylacetoacetate hydrolase family protein [Yoonia sp. 2307UL14-13]|uniref:fumarylacetoacetate hydrolase family protein n=1 Tax=Yoonia sp. 2307UL14-13 TaxID=3126506 RepID=UPI0030B3E1CA